MKCQNCGAENPSNATFCVSCGFQIVGLFKFTGEPRFTRHPPATDLFILAGVLSIIAGSMAILESLLSLGGFVSVIFYPHSMPLAVSASLKLLFGALAVMGGLLAFSRSRKTTALLCSLFGVPAAGFFIGLFVGGVAVVLMSIGWEDPDLPPATYAHKKRA